MLTSSSQGQTFRLPSRSRLYIYFNLETGDMRIGITGASGAGKSRLSLDLCAATGLPLADEGAREAAVLAGISSSQQLAPENSEKFQIEVLKKKIVFEDTHPRGFVSDRTVIDCAAYFLLRERHGILTDEACRRMRANYFATIGERLRTHGYHALVVLEFGKYPWANDGFRSRDDEMFPEVLRHLIAETFVGDLECFGTRIVNCPAKIDDRVAFLRSALSPFW